VLQGDRDEVTLEHGAAVAAALPDGRLAVLPGSHALPVENPPVVNALLVPRGSDSGRQLVRAWTRSLTSVGQTGSNPGYSGRHMAW
jgi:hypothetical protein